MLEKTVSKSEASAGLQDVVGLIVRGNYGLVIILAGFGGRG